MGETAYILVKDLFFLEFKDTNKTASYTCAISSHL